MPEENWMKIPLKSDWESKISGKARIYPLSIKNKEFVNQTFDKLYELSQMLCNRSTTSLSYLVFCIWKTKNRKQKRQIVVNIYGLNAIIQLDTYPIII